jgi:hypothetical protein
MELKTLNENLELIGIGYKKYLELLSFNETIPPCPPTSSSICEFASYGRSYECKDCWHKYFKKNVEGLK